MRTLDGGGIDTAVADRVVENAVGVYALPLGIGLNFVVNGRDILVPMAVEEPSVIAAASNAARMVREGGGFVAEADDPVMTAQIEIVGVDDPDAARKRVEAGQRRAAGAGARDPAPPRRSRRRRARAGGAARTPAASSSTCTSTAATRWAPTW
jgi:hydroxymethylglutaryl-CoA reductase